MATNILALDIGEKRIGVARANLIAKISTPLITLDNDEDFKTNLQNLMTEHDADTIVVGLPRGLQGSETAQSTTVRDFISLNLSEYDIIWQDETLSTVAAEASMNTDSGIDAAAAAVILNDYINENL